MSHPPNEPTTPAADGSIANAAKPKRSVAQKLRHLQRTAEGIAQRKYGPSRDRQHRQRKSDRPSPSLPPTPWDKKPDVAD